MTFYRSANRTARILGVTVSALALMACSAGSMMQQERAASTGQTPTTQAAPQAAPQNLPPGSQTWTQQRSDIPADSSVRYGQLSNGMRYAIMRNTSPPGQASLRVRIAAGSLMEDDNQLGLAHFIEHMAFNGTTNIPEGDLIPILERLGLAFGPDTNAFTSFDQTVYQLDLPNTGEETVTNAFFILREMVGEMTLDAGAIDRERGIVISEERTRATPGLRAVMARYDFLMRGQLIPRRFPIGDVEVLRTAPREAFVSYYERYYRPERATIVAVGDFDVDEMEQHIRRTFSDWRNENPAGPDPVIGDVAERGPEVGIYVETGTQPSMQIAWVSPPDLSPDMLETRRMRTIRNLGFAVLNRRYQNMARSENPPFTSASGFRSTDLNAIDTVSLYASFEPANWQRALEAMEQEARRITQFGITEAELQREITESRASLQSAVAGADTRRTPQLSNQIIGTVNDDRVFTAPATNLEIFEATVSDLTAEQVSAVLREAFSGSGPIVFITSPTPIEGGEAAVLAALNASQATTVQPVEQASAIAWPYSDFGQGSAIVSQTEIADLETTLVRFENGVTLTVKPTAYRNDQVLVSVRAGQGYLAVPRDRFTPLFALSNVMPEGGLGQLTAQQLEEALAGRVYGASVTPGESSYLFSGGTRPQDLRVQLEVLTAYLTDPAWRPEPFERLRTVYRQALGQLDATPSGVFSRESGALLRSGDGRFAFPTADQIASARIEQLRDPVMTDLARGPIEVIIVGDVDVDTAIAEVQRTFGALPTRQSAPEELASARDVRFPQGVTEPVQLTHSGRADQALGYVAWPTVDSRESLYEARVVSLLAGVMRLRLIEELREGQAVTYSPGVSSTASWNFPGYGYLSASMEAPPEAMAEFFSDVDDIAAQLVNETITLDELERARRPAVEALRRNMNTNEYWRGQLQDLHTDETRLHAIRSAVADLERITPEEIQRAARTYLVRDRAWRATVTPRSR